MFRQNDTSEFYFEAYSERLSAASQLVTYITGNERE